MIDWKLAPEGADKVIQYNQYLVWAKDEHYWNVDNDAWERDCCPKENIVICIRDAQKTVKDAVEWAKDKEAPTNWNHIRKCGATDKFFFASGEANSEGWVNSSLICTREEFEAYVKEQAGEKWTHTHDFLSGEKVRCIVVAEHNKYSWLLTEGGGMVTGYTESLKPIKPTISESEAWRKAVDGESITAIQSKYNII